MVEREIHLVVERDKLIPDTKYAGFAGEHLATVLLFTIPEDWALEESVQYYVAYETESRKRYRTENLPWPVETSIPQAATEEGTLTVQLNAVKMQDEDIQLVKSASCKLLIGPSVKEEYTEADNAMVGLLEGAVADFQEALEELNSIVFNPDELKQGPKGDPGEPGPQGPQGEKGEKGDKGDPGDITGLAPVASSGSYNDLTDTPQIPQKASDIHAADSGDFAIHTANTDLHKTAQDIKSLEWAKKYKGYYTDRDSLRAAYPQGETGDFAAVGETHTFWFWDSTLTVWVDAGGEGVVSSVNFQTGEVHLQAADIPASPPAGESGWTDTQAFLNGLNDREKALEESKGQLGGIATLDETGKLTYSQLPVFQSSIKVYRQNSEGKTYNADFAVGASGSDLCAYVGLISPGGEAINSLQLWEDRTNMTIPLAVTGGGTGANTAAGARTNLGMGKLLWSGNWAPGSGPITAPEIGNYTAVIVGTSNGYRTVCSVSASKIRGLSCTDNDGSNNNLWIIGFECDRSGSTLSDGRAVGFSHLPEGNHSSTSGAVGIINIIGLC